MDFVSSAANIGSKLSEVYSDYERGKQTRLGSYKGPNNIKEMGHYSKSGKHLGIYHG
jgi:hypothetical protein